MRHRKKNLTLAKTSSVHKLNCALQRNFQLIGSCFKQESPKLCHYESWLLLPWNSISAHITSRHLHYEFTPGSNKMSHPKVWDRSKKLTKKQQQQKQVHLVSNIWKTKLDIEKWEKYISHCTFKSNSKNTTSDQKNHHLSWSKVHDHIISSEVKSDEAHWRKKRTQNNYHLTWWQIHNHSSFQKSNNYHLTCW